MLLSDRPVAPINVTAVGTGVGSLLVSWSFANSEEVVENFTLTATNLNNTDISTIIVPGITGQNYTLTREDITYYGVYSLQVLAWNDVGPGTFSNSTTSSFLSLPDLSTVALQHSLRIVSGEGVKLTVAFNISMEVCKHTLKDFDVSYCVVCSLSQ